MTPSLDFMRGWSLAWAISFAIDAVCCIFADDWGMAAFMAAASVSQLVCYILFTKEAKKTE